MPPHVGAQEKSGGHIKKNSSGAGICKLLATPLHTLMRSGCVAGNMNQRDRPPRAAGEARSDVTSRGQCAKPTEPRNGRVRVRQRGKVAKFRCVKRFRLYGTARVVCNNRTWSHLPPVCVGKTRTPPLYLLTLHDILSIPPTYVIIVRLFREKF